MAVTPMKTLAQLGGRLLPGVSRSVFCAVSVMRKTNPPLAAFPPGHFPQADHDAASGGSPGDAAAGWYTLAARRRNGEGGVSSRSFGVFCHARFNQFCLPLPSELGRCNVRAAGDGGATGKVV